MCADLEVFGDLRIVRAPMELGGALRDVRAGIRRRTGDAIEAQGTDLGTEERRECLIEDGSTYALRERKGVESENNYQNVEFLSGDFNRAMLGLELWLSQHSFRPWQPIKFQYLSTSKDQQH